jgi:hypothetical protein
MLSTLDDVAINRKIEDIKTGFTSILRCIETGKMSRNAFIQNEIQKIRLYDMTINRLILIKKDTLDKEKLPYFISNECFVCKKTKAHECNYCGFYKYCCDDHRQQDMEVGHKFYCVLFQNLFFVKCVTCQKKIILYKDYAFIDKKHEDPQFSKANFIYNLIRCYDCNNRLRINADRIRIDKDVITKYISFLSGMFNYMKLIGNTNYSVTRISRLCWTCEKIIRSPIHCNCRNNVFCSKKCRDKGCLNHSLECEFLQYKIKSCYHCNRLFGLYDIFCFEYYFDGVKQICSDCYSSPQ